MALSRTLNLFLDREWVHYDVVPHPEAFRAMAVTQTLHIPEKEIAQVVIVKVDERFVMTVLSASWNVNRHRLQDVCMPHHVRLATEDAPETCSPAASRAPYRPSAPSTLQPCLHH